MKKLHLALAAAAVAITAAAAPAVAKDVTYNPYYTPASTAAVSTESDIVVTPYYRERTRRGEESVSMSARVSTYGLNLRYDQDVRELERRVNYTARDLCNEVERVARDSITTDRECIRNAVRGAQPQVDAAVQRARYY